MSSDHLVKVLDSISTALFSLRDEVKATRLESASFHRQVLAALTAEDPQWSTPPGLCASKVNLGAAAKYATCTLRHGHDGLHEEDDVTWTDMVDGKGALYLDVHPAIGRKGKS